MKKILSVLLLAALSVSVIAGCANGGDAAGSSTPASAAPSSSGEAASEPSSAAELKKIVIGASPTPHAEILEQAAPLLKEKGYELDIQEFSDYVQPNLALDSGDLDANYFQHKPYLDDFNKEKGTKLVSAGAIHYEPFGLYGGKTKSLDAIADGASVAVPNDVTNEARALLLLQDQGLIKLKADAGLTATTKEIEENPKNLKIEEIEAPQLVRSLQDVDFAIINGNYAIQGGLKVSDALAKEEGDSLAATTYANIVAVREEDKDNEGIKALVEVLKSDEIKNFINEKYAGSVVPAE